VIAREKTLRGIQAKRAELVQVLAMVAHRRP
jgi:hypothetical protein